LHGDGHAHSDRIRYKADGEASEVDDVEDGGGLCGEVELVEEVDEGFFVDAARFEEGSVRADEASAFVLGAALGEDYRHGKTLGSRWMGWLRMEVHEISSVLFHRFRVDLFQGGFAFGVGRRRLVIIVEAGRRIVEGPCCFVGVEFFVVGAGGVVVVVVSLKIGFLLFGDGAGD
jgi:hypothetical protein